MTDAPDQEGARRETVERGEKKLNLATTVILLLLFFGLLGWGAHGCVRALNQSHFL